MSDDMTDVEPTAKRYSSVLEMMADVITDDKDFVIELAQQISERQSAKIRRLLVSNVLKEQSLEPQRTLISLQKEHITKLEAKVKKWKNKATELKATYIHAEPPTNDTNELRILRNALAVEQFNLEDAVAEIEQLKKMKQIVPDFFYGDSED